LREPTGDGRDAEFLPSSAWIAIARQRHWGYLKKGVAPLAALIPLMTASVSLSLALNGIVVAIGLRCLRDELRKTLWAELVRKPRDNRHCCLFDAAKSPSARDHLRRAARQ
jgi:hypothetical protein